MLSSTPKTQMHNWDVIILRETPLTSNLSRP
jgi:hypothetical protein